MTDAKEVPMVDASAPSDASFLSLHSPERKSDVESKDDTVDYSADDLSRKLLPLMDIQGAKGSEVFCLKWSPDSQFLASGCGDGVIRIYNSKGRIAYNLNISTVNCLPTTCIRFRPATAASKTKNVLISANADGTVQHWHMTSQKRLYKIVEEDNQVFALDYRQDGEMFATAGRDCKVRLYEESTKSLITAMSGGVVKISPGHSNRVFSLKFRPDDPNVLLSGGWDNTIQVWDVRSGHSVRSIYGPHICGDALDIYDQTILSGSWRPDEAVQLWDLGTGKSIRNVEWSGGISQSAMIYTAQFSPDGQLVAAGGTGSNDAKLFDLKHEDKLLGRMGLGGRGVYTLDFSPNNRKIAIAGGSHIIGVRELK